MYHGIQPQWSYMSQRVLEGILRCLLSSEEVHLCLTKHSQDLCHHPRVKHPFPGHRAPASTGYLLPYWDAQECELLSARGVCPGTTQGSGMPACTGGVNADLLGGWCKRPLLCCQCAPTHGDLLGLGGSVSVLYTRPTSPTNWCATWDGYHSTDRGQGGHPWLLPNWWGTCP